MVTADILLVQLCMSLRAGGFAGLVVLGPGASHRRGTYTAIPLQGTSRQELLIFATRILTHPLTQSWESLFTPSLLQFLPLPPYQQHLFLFLHPSIIHSLEMLSKALALTFEHPAESLGRLVKHRLLGLPPEALIQWVWGGA